MPSLRNRHTFDRWLVVVLAIFLSAAWYAPSHATTIDEAELEVMGWTHYTSAASVPKSACNYMYVNHNANGRLLYYGRSENCYGRLAQHENAVLATRPFINAYDDGVHQETNAGTLGRIRGRFVQWADGVNLSGDVCLVAVSISFNYEIYYLDLSKAADGAAKNAEECVLFGLAKGTNGFKGECNKIGSANTMQDWKSAKLSLMGCKASTK